MAKSDRTKTERTNTQTHPTDTSGLRTDGAQAQKLDGLRRTGHAACERGPTMTRHNQNVQFRHSRMTRWRKALSVLSAIVVSVTTYALILPAITDSVKTWCGLEEHVHNDSCYELQLICGLEEGTSETVVVDAGHRHTEDCYAEQKVLICGEEEHQPGNDETKAAGHVHTDACYEMQRGLVCGQEERDPVVEALSPHVHTEECYRKVLCCTRPEHRHEELCYSNPDAIETPEEWELKMPLDARSGVWADDLLLIADSQLGFKESEENFTLIDGERRGYTRFGDWYGDRYGDWGAMFVSFCLSYADIPETIVPYASDPACWAEALQEQALYRTRLADEDGSPAPEYAPQKGDLVFFKDAEDENETPVRVGIVREVAQKEEETLLWTVEGDVDHQVANRAYALDAAEIVGFAALPERPEWLAASFLHEDEGTQTAADEQTETVPGETGETLPGGEDETVPGEAAETSETAESEPAAPTEPVLESDKNPAALSAKNVGETFLRIEKNTLVFEGGDYVITVSYGEESGIPEASTLQVKELAPDSKRYEKHEEEASEQLAEDQELTYARFFDIKIIDAEGNELLLSDAPGVTVEIQLLDKPLLEEGGSVSVVHFADEGAERIDPEQTVLSEDDELEAVRFRAGGFSVWGVVQSRVMEPQTLTAAAEGVHFLLDAPGQARIPEGANLEAVELLPGTKEYEDCYAEALRLLEEQNEETEIVFARFFDLTIRDKNGRELEPSSAVNVRFSYDEQLELALGQTMYVVHFGDEGTELIETDLSRPVDANGAELTGTQVDFKQGSFSITGTVLTGSQLRTDGVFNGFPQSAAEYYVTFDATVGGVTKTYAMGYGGVVEEVRYDSTDNKITFIQNHKVRDAYLQSFSWYYTNLAYTANKYFKFEEISGDKNKTDYYGNFLFNDKPFSDPVPAGNRKGGIQTLLITKKKMWQYTSGSDAYSNLKNTIAYENGYWDRVNYSYVASPNVTPSGDFIANYGYMGGFSTFVVKTSKDSDGTVIYKGVLPLDAVAQNGGIVDEKGNELGYQNSYRPARSLYVEEDGDIRLAMGSEIILQNGAKTMYPIITDDSKREFNGITAYEKVVPINKTDNTAYPVKNPDGTYPTESKYLAEEDAVLVLNQEGGTSYWCWIYPHQIGKTNYENVVKVTNLRFSTGYKIDTTADPPPANTELPANPANPLAALQVDDLESPSNSKSLMPNHGGDGTYSLSLSVTGDYNDASEGVVADVLVVLDLSNSMLETNPGDTQTRYEVMKTALGNLKDVLMGRNTATNTVVNMNLMTFGSWARKVKNRDLAYSFSNSVDWVDVDPAWVSQPEDFNTYIAELPKAIDNKLQGATNWEDALEQAYVILQRRRAAVASDPKTHVQYLVFLTDGDPTCYNGSNKSNPSEASFENDPTGAWLWKDHLYGSRTYFGNGNTTPPNIWYSLQEARDDAREIVWGLNTTVGNEGLTDALTNTHVDASGKTEAVTTYLYAVAALGKADTLSNLLGYAYNGSFEGTYPSEALFEATSESALTAAFGSIAKDIYTVAGYTNISIYDPVTDMTRVAAEKDLHTAFKYYKYRCDEDFNIYGDSQALSETPRYTAVKNTDGVVTHYLDTQNGNVLIENIFEVLPPWDRSVTVSAYGGGALRPPISQNTTLQEAEFHVVLKDAAGNEVTEADIQTYFTGQGGDPTDEEAYQAWRMDHVGSDPTQGKPFWSRQELTWDLKTKDSYLDLDNRSTNRYVLEKGYAYTVVVSVWPKQELFDAVASLSNDQCEISNLDMETKYLHDSGSDYYYDTNLRGRDSAEESEHSLATISYQRYDRYYNPDEVRYVTELSEQQTQYYINPDPVPLTETKIKIKKKWEAFDPTVLEHLIQEEVDARLQAIDGRRLESWTNDQINALPAEQKQSVMNAYSVQIVPLVKTVDESFYTIDANAYEDAFEGARALYFNEDGTPWSVDLYPSWHFYGTLDGEDDPNHKGRIVMDGDFSRNEPEIAVGVGTMISEANFNPLDHPGATKPIVLSAPPNAETGVTYPTGTYYIIEDGFDYSLREASGDPNFSLKTETFHPMLVDDKLYDLEITGEGTAVLDGVTRTVYTGHVKASGSTFIVENRLRPQLTIAEETLNVRYGTYGVYNYQGVQKSETVSFRGQTATYNPRPDEQFTVHVEITVNPETTPILEGRTPDTFFVRYPAYLDQMVADGYVRQEDLDDYLMYEGQHISFTPQYVTVSETLPEVERIGIGFPGDSGSAATGSRDRTYCTSLVADVTLTANQSVRVYNLPEGTTVSISERKPRAWSLELCDWEDTDHSHDLYGSSTAATALDKDEVPTALTAFGTGSSSGLGFSKPITAVNGRYFATLYNRIIPVDLELKKIDSMTASRATVTLTDSTTPAGSGTAYDDTAIPGLAGAQFTLYRRLADSEEVAPADMATYGVLWLKPDGTTVSGGERPTGAVQVVPARNYNGVPIVAGTTRTNGKHCFENLSLGTYCLVETVRPEGYDAPSIPEGSVGYLTVTVGTGETTFTQPDANGGASQTAIFRVEDGPPARAVYEIVITNTSGGTELPRTGGVGRELPTVLGAVLILIGAIALLIKKSRAKGGRTTA